jgi:uncharacterized membrane protein YbhN (UPF0104 family)
MEVCRNDSVRRVKSALLVIGVLVVGILVYRVGATPIVETLRRLTWWQFLLVCLPYALTTAADTLAWRFAFIQDRTPFARLFGARMAGEALNIVTALGSVGGEAVKAWLIRRDVAYDESVASLVAAKTTITIAQALFLGIGIALAWAWLPVDAQLLPGMLGLLVLEVLAVAGFLGAQATGLVGRGGRLLQRLGVVRDAAYARALDETLRIYYRQHWRRFAFSVGLHLAGWLLGGLEAVLILWALDLPASLLTATVVEALGSGVRFATFLVPASVGALESANAAAFTALGLGAGAGLAFSFVRRARQAVWVVLGLLVLLVMRPPAQAGAAAATSSSAVRRPSVSPEPEGTSSGKA